MNFLKTFLTEKSGNTSIMFAGVLILLIGASGFAIDSNIIRSESVKLQASADAGALAGAISAHKLSELERQGLARGGFDVNASNFGTSSAVESVTVNFDDSTQTVTVTARARPRLFIMPFVSGRDEPLITVESQAGYKSVDRRPIAIAMVLDVSGSMGWNSADGTPKIDSLKIATQSLFTSVDGAVSDLGPIDTVLSTSVTTYNSNLLQSTPLQPGFATTQSAIDALVAGGGTNSAPALQAGMDVLLNNPNRIGQSYREYLVFMTDGDNNDASSDVFSADICKQARENDITVYSVAFEAPEKGQSLMLVCASSKDDPARSNANRSGNSNGQGKGKGPFPIPPGHDKCRKNPAASPSKECLEQKSGFYYEADSALDFEKAFKGIGASIGDEAIRIK